MMNRIALSLLLMIPRATKTKLKFCRSLSNMVEVHKKRTKVYKRISDHIMYTNFSKI